MQEKGWLKSGGKQRTDATHILGQVHRLSQFELKWESLRMALVDLISTDARWVFSHLSEDLTRSYASSQQQTGEFKQDMKHRNAIEGTISEAVRGHGLRRNRYRGLAKTQFQAHMTGTAINLKRLMAVIYTIIFILWNGNRLRFSTESSMLSLLNPVELYGRNVCVRSNNFSLSTLSVEVLLKHSVAQTTAYPTMEK